MMTPGAPEAWRVVLAGNNRAAVYVLELLLELVEAEQVLVLAPPEGGTPEWQVSIAEQADRLGIAHLTPKAVNSGSVLDQLRVHGANLFLSVYYTQIFRPELLDAVAGPCLNFHPALLPRHRGTAPLIWSIVEDEHLTGLTVHHIDRGVDTGAIVSQHSLPIHPEDTGWQLHQKMALLVRSTAAELLRDLAAGHGVPEGQPQGGPSTYHSMRDPRLNHIDWSEPAERIRNIVRALAPPLPGAYGLLDGEPLVLARVEQAEPALPTQPKQPGMFELARPGIPPLIWTGKGALRVTDFMHEGELRPGGDLARLRGVTEGALLA
jgi:methionyl-tRNA formyltransferase